MEGNVSNSVAEPKQRTLQILDELLPEISHAPINVRLWDGTLWPNRQKQPTTVILKHPGSLRAMCLPGTELGLGEAYLRDDFDIEGNIEGVFNIADAMGTNHFGFMHKARTALHLLRLPGHDGWHELPHIAAHLGGKRHSPQRDRQAIAYHYNVSNDFFALWLDRRMVYSCAYFRDATESLDAAQERKLDYLCRKLRLRPGQKLLDIGCGWGGLILHAARHYGVDATGITLSQPQAEWATRQIAEAGLSDRCRVIVRDYRELKKDRLYDALVSVGMFEHVGLAHLPEYFRDAFQHLRPRGVFLNHGIACSATSQMSSGPSFIDTYVFPDGELVPINVTLNIAEEAEFKVRDVENLREHYTLTLRHWVHRLERNHQLALKHVSEEEYRIWRLYMAGSAHGFDVGSLNLYQTLMVKLDEHGASGLPLTRDDWYRSTKCSDQV